MQISFARTASPITSKVVIAYDDDGNEAVGFKIVGPDSPQYRAEQERQRLEGLKRRINGGKKPKDFKSEEAQAELDRLTQENLTRNAVAVVVDWFGFKDGDIDVPFDAAMLPEFFAAHQSWRDKVVDAIYQEDAFLPKPAKG